MQAFTCPHCFHARDGLKATWTRISLAMPCGKPTEPVQQIPQHPAPLSQKCSAHPLCHTIVLDRLCDGPAERKGVGLGPLRETNALRVLALERKMSFAGRAAKVTRNFEDTLSTNASEIGVASGQQSSCFSPGGAELAEVNIDPARGMERL